MSEDETNKVLEKINSTEIKMQLRKNTEDAVECGVSTQGTRFCL